MKRVAYAIIVMAAVAFVSCGGGGGSGPTPTPTSNETKAATQVAESEASSATGQAAFYAFQNMQPVAMIVKQATQNYESAINTTNACDGGGSVAVTGNARFSCTGVESASWSCTVTSFATTLVFTNCAGQATFEGTAYSVILNGTASSSATGSASGTGESFDSLNFQITFTGSQALNATGCVTGTVDISDIVVNVAGTGGAEPTTTCSGTSTVVFDSTTEVCSISGDCSTCTQ